MTFYINNPANRFKIAMGKYNITTDKGTTQLEAISFGQAELIFAKYGNPSDIISIEKI